jgi:hypothetical protein
VHGHDGCWDHPAGDLIQPADADLPDPNVRDRAGVPPSSLIWLRSRGLGGGRKSGFVGPLESQLASRLSGYATPAAMGTFGSDASCCLVGADEPCSAQNPRIGLMIIPQNTARARLISSRSP